MAGRRILNIALGLTLLITSPALAPVVGGVAMAEPDAGAANVLAGQIAAAVSAEKASYEYMSASPGQKALLLANAVKAVVVAALQSGESIDTISSALNAEVQAGVIDGSVAVEAAVLAALQVPGAGAGLVADVRRQPAVRASLAANGGGDFYVTRHGSGHTVTLLVSLSRLLDFAAGSDLTTDGQVTGERGDQGASDPCVNVLADYC